MGNIISNSDLFSHLKCSECQEVLDQKSDYGIQYLAYIIGKGKYNKRYYCLNCLDELMKKNR
tara:strand:- start:3139 stop:3324 length:186 start_codon:yes stop_codon:yes gene_type:complete